jgi:glycosyltransferase involved in cell wall biosynthesis
MGIRPLFSIVIPIYNVETYLRLCLDSVLDNEIDNYEVVCIDDGSTDGSSVILKEYSNKHQNIKIINQENKGLSAARNVGIKASKGEYVFFIDSDDWLESGALDVLAKSISGEDMICFNGRRFFEDGTVENPDTGIIEEGLTGWEYYNKYALIHRKFHFVCVVLRLYKRTFLLEYNLFFEEGVYHEDNLFTPLACFKARRVKVIPHSVYVYRIRPGSITQSANSKRLFDLVKVANKLAAFFIPIKDIDKRTVYREIAGEYFKGFMSEERKKYGNIDNDLIKQINWESFKSVCIYPRHKRIYFLLKINPMIFRIYLFVEMKLIKPFILS